MPGLVACPASFSRRRKRGGTEGRPQALVGTAALVTERGLIRGVDLRGAVAVNVIGMVGVGPLITVPLVLGALHGPLSLIGWILGALLALCDGLVWSELGALYPGSGGTYGYLRAVFGPTRAGSLLAFVFAWQTIFAAPLNSAVGYIGMANYTGYLFPALSDSPWAIKALAIAFGSLTLVALFREIRTIARIGIVLAGAVLLTLLCIITAAYAHFTPSLVTAFPPGDSLWTGLRMGLGQGLLIAIYDYLGYNQASCIGDEVIRPARTLPLAILISVGLVAALYLTLQLGILGAIPWTAVIPRADGSLPPIGQHLASAIVERTFGAPAATIVTILIVVSAFASMYANLLGYSRIPYAAAVQGQFLRPFAHLNAKHRFPDVALLTIGLLALPACLLPLDAVFNALTTGMVLIQSVAQIVALAVVRARGIRSPYRMWIYPIPALLALAGWIFVFWSAGGRAIIFGVVTLAVGCGVFLVRAAQNGNWPFNARGTARGGT
jgi:amino acid transporter